VESDADLLARWLEATAAPPNDVVADRSAPADVSFGQGGMWITQAMRGPSDASFRMRHTYRILGPLDVPVLGEALNDLTARHEPLRTVFRVVDGELKQIVLAPGRPSLIVEEASTGHRDGWLEERTTAFFRTDFDLAVDVPFRARLFRLDDLSHVLVLIIHHIANDGWSMDVLHRDLGELYAARLAGRPAQLKPLPRQYLDLALAERQRHRDGQFGEALRYWREHLSGFRPFPPPVDRPALSMRGVRTSVTLEPGLVRPVDEIADAHRTTGFAVLLTALVMVLAEWSGADDLVLGVAHAGRSEPDTDDLIGPFASVLPLRVGIGGRDAFPLLLGEVRDALLAGNDNAIPLDLILREMPELGTAARAGRPLLLASVSSQIGFAHSLRLDGVTVSYEQPREVDAVQPIAIYIYRGDDGISLALDYPVEMFDRETIEKLLDRYMISLTMVTGRR
jgi:hypothetical protein